MVGPPCTRGLQSEVDIDIEAELGIELPKSDDEAEESEEEEDEQEEEEQPTAQGDAQQQADAAAAKALQQQLSKKVGLPGVAVACAGGASGAADPHVSSCLDCRRIQCGCTTGARIAACKACLSTRRHLHDASGRACGSSPSSSIAQPRRAGTARTPLLPCLRAGTGHFGP